MAPPLMQTGLRIMLIVKAISATQVTPTFVTPALYLLELQMSQRLETFHTSKMGTRVKAEHNSG